MMVLSDADRTLYQERLREAGNALHELMIGRQARVFVDQNGERVEYAMANADRLRAYILTLQTALGVRPQAVGPLQHWIL